MVIGVLMVLFSLGFGLIGRMSGETRWIRRIINGEICTTVAEAVVEEMIYSVRSEMNQETSDLYNKLRAPNPAPILFEPTKVRESILKDDYDLTHSAVDIKAIISLEDPQPFDTAIDPSPQPGEMKATMKFFASVSIGDVIRKVSVLKDFKIVNLCPPPPLDEYIVWLINEKAGWPKDQGKFNDLTNPIEKLKDSIENLPQNIKDRIEQHVLHIRQKWRYRWGSAYSENFPFCREKVSHYFKKFKDFEESMCQKGPSNRRIYNLDGITVISEKKRKFKLAGTIRNKGMIISRRTFVQANNIFVPPNSLLSLAVLEDDLYLPGNVSDAQAFRGAVYVPKGILKTDRNTKIKGHVFAMKWDYDKDGNTVEMINDFNQSSFYATLSHQITLWQEESK